MYSADTNAKRRLVAELLVFVYAYFGFVAAMHHTDGFVPTGRALSFCAYACHLTHARISVDLGATECGVCSFLTSLTSPALPVHTRELPSCATPSGAEPYESLTSLQPSTLHAPRGPPC
jgi:hypothetical protein